MVKPGERSVFGRLSDSLATGGALPLDVPVYDVDPAGILQGGRGAPLPAAPTNALLRATGTQEDMPMPIRAYHSSPYDFNNFKMGKVNTGEGTQQEGYGLYFAEHPKVNEFYRNQFDSQNASPDMFYNGKVLSDLSNSDAYLNIFSDVLERGMSPKESIHYRTSELQSRIDNIDAYVDQLNRPAYPGATPQFTRSDMLSRLKRDLKRTQSLDPDKLEVRSVGPKSTSYEVEVNTEPHQMLFREASILEQSPFVQERLPRAVESLISGFNAKDQAEARAYYSNHSKDKDPYRTLLDIAIGSRDQLPFGYQELEGRPLLEVQRKVSKALRLAGISGHRYLDAASAEEAGAPTNTSNYVIFDPKLIKIVRKWGLAGAGLGAALAAGGQPDQAQAAEQPTNRLTYHTGQTF